MFGGKKDDDDLFDMPDDMMDDLADELFGKISADLADLKVDELQSYLAQLKLQKESLEETLEKEKDQKSLEDIVKIFSRPDAKICIMAGAGGLPVGYVFFFFFSFFFFVL